MSEKRFTHLDVLGNPTIWDKKNGKMYIQYDEETTDEIVDLLNEQQATIEHLNNECKGLVSMFEEEVKENGQLRKTINEVIELLAEEVDLFSDEATEHDIIAYREMKNFDNKDAYYICTATKKAIQMLKGRDSDE